MTAATVKTVVVREEEDEDMVSREQVRALFCFPLSMSDNSESFHVPYMRVKGAYLAERVPTATTAAPSALVLLGVHQP